MELEKALYRPSELVALTGLSKPTIYRLIAEGTIATVELRPGGLRRVPATAVLALARGELPVRLPIDSKR